jgi:uncharacterized protein
MKINTVWLMLTDKCNLDCHFCYQKNKGSAESNEKTLDKSIEFILANSTEDVEVTLWGGEPLLRFDLVKYVVEKYSHLNIRLATNGYLLNKEITDFFIKHTDSIGVCLSVGAGKTPPEIYGLTRINKLFAHVVPGDLSKISDTVDMLYRQGIKKFQLGMAHLGEYTESDYETYRNEIKKILKRFRESFWEEDGIKILNWEDTLKTHFDSRPACIAYCGAGLNMIAIAPNGDIYPCDWFYDLKAYKIGNINDGFNAQRGLFVDINSNRSKYFDKCKGCKIENECRSHMCLAENLTVNKSIYEPVFSTCKATMLERETVINEGVKHPQLRRKAWATQW